MIFYHVTGAYCLADILYEGLLPNDPYRAWPADWGYSGRLACGNCASTNGPAACGCAAPRKAVQADFTGVYVCAAVEHVELAIDSMAYCVRRKPSRGIPMVVEVELTPEQTKSLKPDPVQNDGVRFFLSGAITVEQIKSCRPYEGMGRWLEHNKEN